jgi:hypothetical protein
MNTQGNSNDLRLSETLHRLMRYWWLVAAAIVVGGVIGSLFPFLRTPLYESTSVISTSIDFAYAGKLSELEEDQMIVAVGNLIGSTEVMTAVEEQAAQSGIMLADGDIAEHISLSRQGYQWELSTLAETPAEAQKLNAIWLSIAEQTLLEERTASLEVLRQLTAGESLEACFSQSAAVEPAVSVCDLEDFQSLLEEIPVTNPQQENLRRGFLLSRITTRVTRDPSFPSQPVLFNRNLTTLAGGFIGLIVALAFFLFTDVKKATL